MERGVNGGVRFQVIRWTKVEKFKVDGDDFFPIACSSPKKIKTFNKKFAWVEHLNAILAQKVGNMNEPIFQSSNARGVGVGEWWSLELIYA